jgi:hypothetical protein
MHGQVNQRRGRQAREHSESDPRSLNVPDHEREQNNVSTAERDSQASDNQGCPSS